MIIEDVLISKLTKSGLVVPGTTLFNAMMPAEVSIGVMIKPPLTGIKIDPYIKDWHKTRMQIITRHIDPVEGEILANKICNELIVEKPELHKTHNCKIVRFYPEALPVQFPRLKGNGIEFSQHFQTVFAVI